LLVLKAAGSNAAGTRMWQCQCDCGRKCVVSGRRMRNGHTSSCGCLQKERAAAASAKAQTTHGMRYTPEWLAWKNMRGRCNDPGNPSYPRYGGRGVKVCARWSEFQPFFDDMGARPSKRASIDRKDNDGDYTPENCHWASQKEQARNRRTSTAIEFRGQTRTVAEIADITHVPSNILYSRIYLGWDIERAVSTPVQARSKRIRTPAG